MLQSVLVYESCLDVDRHQGRLIFLEYEGEGEIDSTVFLVGKGITYDTGGLDIKSMFLFGFIALRAVGVSLYF